VHSASPGGSGSSWLRRRSDTSRSLSRASQSARISSDRTLLAGSNDRAGGGYASLRMLVGRGRGGAGVRRTMVSHNTRHRLTAPEHRDVGPIVRQRGQSSSDFSVAATASMTESSESYEQTTGRAGARRRTAAGPGVDSDRMALPVCIGSRSREKIGIRMRRVHRRPERREGGEGPRSRGRTAAGKKQTESALAVAPAKARACSACPPRAKLSRAPCSQESGPSRPWRRR